jgi:hypothetical protein
MSRNGIAKRHKRAQKRNPKTTYLLIPAFCAYRAEVVAAFLRFNNDVYRNHSVAARGSSGWSKGDQTVLFY